MVFVRAYNIRRKARTPVPDVLLRHRQAPCPTFEKLRSHLPVGGGTFSQASRTVQQWRIFRNGRKRISSLFFDLLKCDVLSLGLTDSRPSMAKLSKDFRKTNFMTKIFAKVAFSQ